jgi:hypothetical protein
VVAERNLFMRVADVRHGVAVGEGLIGLALAPKSSHNPTIEKCPSLR